MNKQEKNLYEDFLNPDKYQGVKAVISGLSILVLFFFGIVFSFEGEEQYLQANLLNAISSYTDLSITNVQEEENTLHLYVKNNSFIRDTVLITWKSLVTEDKGFFYLDIPSQYIGHVAVPKYDAVIFEAKNPEKVELDPADNIRTYYSHSQ